MFRTSARAATLALAALTGLAGLVPASSASAAVSSTPVHTTVAGADDCGRELGEWIDGGHAVYRGNLRAELSDETVEAIVSFQDDRVEVVLDGRSSGSRRHRFNPDRPGITWTTFGFSVLLDRPTCERDGVGEANLALRAPGLGRLQGQVHREE
ncbi:hypothetical protein [Streptosporangium sp. NPDC000239]|uniref:Uncharacterized protein n=1 Tax=Streptosporangium jomthongense TaxID=1193683 RepID=A0ABV8EYF7_9ACTN